MLIVFTKSNCSIDVGLPPWPLALWFVQTSCKEALEEDFRLQPPRDRGLEGEIPEARGIGVVGGLAEKPWFVVASEMHDAWISDGLDGFLHSVHPLHR